MTRGPAYPLATLKAIAEKGPEYAAPSTIERACGWAFARIKGLHAVAEEHAVTKTRVGTADEDMEEGMVTVSMECEVCDAEHQYMTRLPDEVDPVKLAHKDGCPVRRFPGDFDASDTETWRVVEIQEGGHRTVLEESVPAPKRFVAEREYKKTTDGKIRLEKEES